MKTKKSTALMESQYSQYNIKKDLIEHIKDNYLHKEPDEPVGMSLEGLLCRYLDLRDPQIRHDFNRAMLSLEAHGEIALGWDDAEPEVQLLDLPTIDESYKNHRIVDAAFLPPQMVMSPKYKRGYAYKHYKGVAVLDRYNEVKNDGYATIQDAKIAIDAACA